MNDMPEEIKKYLECNRHLRENLEIFKEAFIKYYGEEKREEIEERFQEAIFIAYNDPDSVKRFVTSVKKTITKQIIEKAIEEAKTSLTREDLIENFSFDTPKIMPIAYFYQFYEQYQLGPEKRLENFKRNAHQYLSQHLKGLTGEEYEEMLVTKKAPERYVGIPPWLNSNIHYYTDLNATERGLEGSFQNTKKLLEKIIPDITLENFETHLENSELQKLIAIANQYPQMLENYENALKEFAPYEEMANLQEARQEALKKKYWEQYVKENRDMLEPIQSIEYQSEEEKKKKLEKLKTYLFGVTIGNNGMIDAFSQEAEEERTKKDATKWQIATIQENRIRYFQLIGIDLGDNYEDYVRNEEVRRKWPNKERIEKLQESRKRLLNQFNNEFYPALPQHQAIRQEIDALGLADKDDSFNARLYTKKGTFVNPNIIKTKEGYRLLSLVIINCSLNDGKTDHNIVHELNHLYELYLKKVENGTYQVISGWDTIESEINEKEQPVDTLGDKKEVRQYELFNEIINELITQEIYRKMLEEKKHVFDTEENARIRGTSSYEFTLFLVFDFYNKYKEKILKSRKNGNIQIIWEEVGKENFDALNDLFKEFHKKFPEKILLKTYKELEQGLDTERTREYHKLEESRDAILKRMDTHSMLRQETERKIEESNRLDF